MSAVARGERGNADEGILDGADVAAAIAVDGVVIVTLLGGEQNTVSTDGTAVGEIVQMVAC